MFRNKIILIFRIITDSFYEKADLEQWLVPKPKRECYIELLEAIWNPLVAKNLRYKPNILTNN